MGESLLLITIITLVILTIRRARPVILENPVIIERPGKYHITLAPQLNRAQVFIEKIASQYSQDQSPQGDFPSCYFEVRDPKVFAKGADCYLLAVTMRDGQLYFQATSPDKSNKSSHLKTIQEFSDTVLKLRPPKGVVSEGKPEKLIKAIEEVAVQMQSSVSVLV